MHAFRINWKIRNFALYELYVIVPYKDFHLQNLIFNEGKVALRAFSQAQCCKWTCFSSSTSESGSREVAWWHWHNCLIVKELFTWSRCNIWRLSDCNGTRTHNILVHTQTLNHLPKLVSSLVTVSLYTHLFENKSILT